EEKRQKEEIERQRKEAERLRKEEEKKKQRDAEERKRKEREERDRKEREEREEREKKEKEEREKKTKEEREKKNREEKERRETEERDRKERVKLQSSSAMQSTPTIRSNVIPKSVPLSTGTFNQTVRTQRLPNSTISNTTNTHFATPVKFAPLNQQTHSTSAQPAFAGPLVQSMLPAPGLMQLPQTQSVLPQNLRATSGPAPQPQLFSSNSTRPLSVHMLPTQPSNSVNTLSATTTHQNATLASSDILSQQPLQSTEAFDSSIIFPNMGLLWSREAQLLQHQQQIHSRMPVVSPNGNLVANQENAKSVGIIGRGKTPIGPVGLRVKVPDQPNSTQLINPASGLGAISRPSPIQRPGTYGNIMFDGANISSTHIQFDKTHNIEKLHQSSDEDDGMVGSKVLGGEILKDDERIFHNQIFWGNRATEQPGLAALGLSQTTPTSHTLFDAPGLTMWESMNTMSVNLAQGVAPSGLGNIPALYSSPYMPPAVPATTMKPPIGTKPSILTTSVRPPGIPAVTTVGVSQQSLLSVSPNWNSGRGYF
ncbi:hypothetical protein HK096_009002, partial [Nowakowskiella sp. JEL0078]